MKFKVPHTLILLWAMILVAFVLAWVLPQGEFERTPSKTQKDRMEVMADSYHPIEADRPTWHTPFTVIPRGLGEAKDIIFFVFIIGGALALIRRTGTIDAVLALVLRRLGHRPGVLIGGGMLLFCVGSSTIGMAEEYLPFVPVLLAMCLALKLDAVVAVGIMCIGYGIGYGTALINPFTVIVAQKVAELEPTSGLGYRLLITLPFLALGFLHLMRYANRIRRDPGRSLVADVAPPLQTGGGTTTAFESTHLLVLLLVVVTLVTLIIGIQTHHWYLQEMGALFCGLAVVTVLLGRIGVSEGARVFCAGAAELTTTALLIGFARCIELVLREGKVIDTIVDGLATPLKACGAELGSVGMLAVQSICNLFIPSGSGQALVTMPIMAPLADMVEVERQVAVLAYQFGDGFTNIMIPTNAVLVGILAMAGIPFDRWLRFILPLMAQLILLAAVALVVAVLINWR